MPPLYRSVPRPERFAAVGPNPERDGSGDGGLGKPASSQAVAESPFRPDSLSDREAGTPGSGAERERRGAARCPEVELAGAALGGVCGFGAGARLRRAGRQLGFYGRRSGCVPGVERLRGRLRCGTAGVKGVVLSSHAGGPSPAVACRRRPLRPLQAR